MFHSFGQVSEFSDFLYYVAHVYRSHLTFIFIIFNVNNKEDTRENHKKVKFAGKFYIDISFLYIKKNGLKFGKNAITLIFQYFF